jgi:hypothetical protein|tara:strand:- start:1486 stop:1737 length:252 start_codon:yes stop_codon:yes gene_type:complete
MDKNIKARIIYQSKSLPGPVLDVAIQLIENKYSNELVSYEVYAQKISEDFNCECTAEEIIKRFAVSIEMEDFRLIRKHCGYGN